MQTFLPYPDFKKSAQCLDMRRLGKQRVEAWQIYCTINLVKYDETRKVAWKNHPAVLMWKDSDYYLLLYGMIICEEWIKRGYKDSMLERFKKELDKYSYLLFSKKTPKWFGYEKFHASHRSNLLRKKPEYYSQFGWGEPNDLPYFWPV